jgi:hypothetical protein
MLEKVGIMNFSETFIKYKMIIRWGLQSSITKSFFFLLFNFPFPPFNWKVFSFFSLIRNINWFLKLLSFSDDGLCQIAVLK